MKNKQRLVGPTIFNHQLGHSFFSMNICTSTWSPHLLPCEWTLCKGLVGPNVLLTPLSANVVLCQTVFKHEPTIGLTRWRLVGPLRRWTVATWRTVSDVHSSRWMRKVLLDENALIKFNQYNPHNFVYFDFTHLNSLCPIKVWVAIPCPRVM